MGHARPVVEEGPVSSHDVPEPPRPDGGADPLLAFGLTPEELEVWYDLARVAGKMLALPVQHPMEQAETATEFHVLQHRLLARAGVRAQRGWQPPA
jgi:hypothetical protein